MASLVQVHEPIRSGGRVRLIFIHGLDGRMRETWMANARDEKTLWPKWLGEDSGCPVWLVGFGASSTRWQSDAMDIPKQATAILDRLCSEPSLQNQPSILVGHSMGGLIVKTIIQHGMYGGVSRFEAQVRNIRGVVFVGTPHFGSMLASIAAWTRLARANPQIENLRLHDSSLATLNQYFLKLRAELGFSTRVFVETQPITMPWWLGGRLWPGITIVSSTSSEAHIPNELGIPIEANHITICKPRDKGAAIHKSLLDFVREVSALESSPQTDRGVMTLASDEMEAASSSSGTDRPMHLALSVFGISTKGTTETRVPTCAIITTDEPDRLKQGLASISQKIQKDPLTSSATRIRVRKKSLQELIDDPATRSIALRELAVLSFSAYLYYCQRDEFNALPPENRAQALLVDPLVHRLCKKGEEFQQMHTEVASAIDCVTRAAEIVHSKFGREVTTPRLGTQKYSALAELATVVAHSASQHLSDLADAEAGNTFDCLRTRIRYAANVVSGEKHLRDKNPLP